MSTTDKNLWPPLPVVEGVVTPLSILQKQGAFLKDMTKGFIEVDIRDRRGKGKFQYDFELIIVPLGRHRHHLLTILHERELYPVKVASYCLPEGKKKDAANQQEFEAILSEIFSSGKTFAVIRSFLCQCVPPEK